MSYKIDSVVVQSPSSVEPGFNRLTANENRAVDTGDFMADYINIKYKIVWKYKWISQDELHKITAIVVTSDRNRKNMYHRVTTFNPLTGGEETYTMYCGATIQLPPYIVVNGITYYKDIEISWIEK